MQKWRGLIAVSLVWLLFIIAHRVSTFLFLYWIFWWLDIVMHTLGAVLIISTWFLLDKLAIFPKTFSLTLMHPILCLVYLMVGWEIFEYLIGNVDVSRDNYILDTTIDLLVGLSSGLITFWFVKSRTIGR